MRLRIIHILVLLTACIQVSAQDVNFSQFYSNPVNVNPAFVGMSKKIRVISNYRIQWPNLPSVYVSNSLSLDAYVPAINTGIGLRVLTDNQAKSLFGTTMFSMFLSQSVRMNRKWNMALGVELAYFQKRLNWNLINFEDQIDPRYGFLFPTNETFGRNSFSNLDISSGLILHSDKTFFGLSLNHLTQPKEQFSIQSERKLPMRLSVHAGHSFIYDDYHGTEITFMPKFIYQYQGGFHEVNLGMNVQKSSVYGGIWYRWNDAMIFVTGIQIKALRVAYSLDLNVSRLSRSGGAHEFSLLWEVKKIKAFKKKKAGMVPVCPKFYGKMI